jgi:predicted ABC-type transport system involved in lysophospholipase L1 biosynthesis ATPase subunit
MGFSAMINLANVSKTGASGAEKLSILHAVNLSIPRGQFVAVVGKLWEPAPRAENEKRSS